MKKNANSALPYFLKLSHLYEPDHGLYTEEEFHRLVALEVKRASRSNTVPLLVLLDLTSFDEREEADRAVRKVAPVFFSSTREVDAKGWYRYPSILGILIVDLAPANDSLHTARDAVVDRLRTSLAKSLGSSDLERILFSSHLLEPLHRLLRARG